MIDVVNTMALLSFRHSKSVKLQLHGLAMKHTIKAIIRREGLLGLYGGFWAVASTAG